MESIYLLEKNDSFETITVKFELRLKIHRAFQTIQIRFCDRLLTAVKMAHNVEIDLSRVLNVY